MNEIHNYKNKINSFFNKNRRSYYLIPFNPKCQEDITLLLSNKIIGNLSKRTKT